jgi:hypothetical protein
VEVQVFAASIFDMSQFDFVVRDRRWITGAEGKAEEEGAGARNPC